MGCCPSTCRSAVIWADDFNDGNTDGWDIWGMDYADPGPLPPNYSVSEGMLRFQGETDHWTIAIYNTTEGVGTWSFDLDVQDQDRHHFYVAFFGGYWDNDSIDWDNWLQSVPYEYGIAPFTGPYSSYDDEFVLFRAAPARASFVALDRYSPPEMIGWHHINITRDSSGLLRVYLNGTLRMSATDTIYTTTECFKIYSGSGPAIDNIKFEGEITTPPPPPPTISGFPFEAIILGLIACLGVIVVIRRRRTS